MFNLYLRILFAVFLTVSLAAAFATIYLWASGNFPQANKACISSTEEVHSVLFPFRDRVLVAFFSRKGGL